VKQESGGLLLLRRITPLARRNAVYFRSGAYTLGSRAKIEFFKYCPMEPQMPEFMGQCETIATFSPFHHKLVNRN